MTEDLTISDFRRAGKPRATHAMVPILNMFNTSIHCMMTTHNYVQLPQKNHLCTRKIVSLE